MFKELDPSKVCKDCGLCGITPHYDDHTHKYVIVSEAKGHIPLKLYKPSLVEKLIFIKAESCPIQDVLNGSAEQITIRCPKDYAVTVG